MGLTRVYSVASFSTFLLLCPQLLPVSAAGGRRGLEDQTELLGIAEKRGESEEITTNTDPGPFRTAESRPGVSNHMTA